ncbi:MAG: glycoside hydrolase family 11 protein [Defluviitaleaceae bacterium]|nr:glycoside hydrolase family 11 protein [Defluviitaleaceae bacterium]
MSIRNKRILAWLLAAVMVVSVIPVTAFAYDDANDNGYASANYDAPGSDDAIVDAGGGDYADANGYANGDAGGYDYANGNDGNGYDYANGDDSGYDYANGDDSGYDYANGDDSGYDYANGDDSGYDYANGDDSGYDYANGDPDGDDYANDDDYGYDDDYVPDFTFDDILPLLSNFVGIAPASAVTHILSTGRNANDNGFDISPALLEETHQIFIHGSIVVDTQTLAGGSQVILNEQPGGWQITDPGQAQSHGMDNDGWHNHAFMFHTAGFPFAAHDVATAGWARSGYVISPVAAANGIRIQGNGPGMDTVDFRVYQIIILTDAGVPVFDLQAELATAANFGDLAPAVVGSGATPSVVLATPPSLEGAHSLIDRTGRDVQFSLAAATHPFTAVGTAALNVVTTTHVTANVSATGGNGIMIPASVFTGIQAGDVLMLRGRIVSDRLTGGRLALFQATGATADANIRASADLVSPFTITHTLTAADLDGMRLLPNRWGGAQTDFLFSIDDMIIYRPPVGPQEISFNLAGNTAFQALAANATTLAGGLNLTGASSVVHTATYGTHTDRNFIYVHGRGLNWHGLNVTGVQAGDTVRITGRRGANWIQDASLDGAINLSDGGTGATAIAGTPGSTFTIEGVATGTSFRIAVNAFAGPGTEATRAADLSFYIYSIIVGSNLDQDAVVVADTVNITATENFWPPAIPAIVPITETAITITAPVVNAVAATAAPTGGLTQWTAGTVTWYPGATGGTALAAGAAFTGGQIYRAEFTITPAAGFEHPTAYTVAGATSVARGTGANADVITVVFPATAAAPITALAIGVTVPAYNEPPSTTVTGDLGQWTASIAWFNDATNAPAGATFSAFTTYRAEITITPEPGWTLTGVAANAFTIVNAWTANAANSGVVTAEFTATLGVASVPVTLLAIDGITAPATGAAPVVTAPTGGGTQWTASAIQWFNDDTGLAAGATFTAGTVYRAVTTIATGTGVTLTGVANPGFTVAGATTVTRTGGEVTAVFPATAAAPVTAFAITGVTAPVTGAAPATAAAGGGVAPNVQWTAAIQWFPGATGGTALAAGATFSSDSVYRAVITITPAAGYTLDGVAANAFTVAGATATNAANAGVVTAVFPATAAGPSVIFCLTDLAAFQAMAEGDTFTTSAPLQGSGGAILTVRTYSGYNYIRVTNRPNDWDGVDVMFAGLMSATGVYDVRVTGRIAGNAPAGATLMLQSMPGFGWGTPVSVSTDGEFTITRTVNRATDMGGTPPALWDRFRITSNGAGTNMNFDIFSIEVAEQGGLPAVLPPPRPGATLVPPTGTVQTTNRRWRENGWDFELWFQDNIGSATMTTYPNGSFSGVWTNTFNVLFRAGRDFPGRGTRIADIGDMSVRYTVDEFTTNNGPSYLGLYGWARTATAGTDHLIEWYIVDYWRNWIVGGITDVAGVNRGQYVYRGSVTANGSTYDIFTAWREDMPSIEGTRTFLQIFSVRRGGRLTGPVTTPLARTIDVSAHFDAWNDIGLVTHAGTGTVADWSSNLVLHELTMLVENFAGAANSTGEGHVTALCVVYGNNWICTTGATRCAHCQNAGTGTGTPGDIIWELEVTPGLVSDLNDPAGGVFGGVQAAAPGSTQAGFATFGFDYAGGALLIRGRGESWNSLDIRLDDKGLTADGNYRITVVGNAPDGFQFSWPLSSAPWETGNVAGTVTGISMDFSLSDIPDTLGGGVSPPRIRLRTAPPSIGNMTITSIVIERLGAAGPPPLPPVVCTNPTDFDFQAWLAAHGEGLLNFADNSGRWPFWNTGNQNIRIVNAGNEWQMLVPGSGTGNATGYGTHGVLMRLTGANSLNVQQGYRIAAEGYIRGTMTAAHSGGPGVGFRPGVGGNTPGDNLVTVNLQVGGTDQPFQISHDITAADLGAAQTAHWSGFPTVQLVRQPSQLGLYLVLTDLVIFPICTCGPATVPVTGITVSPANASIRVGATTTLTATVAPANATNPAIQWHTNDYTVAIVSATGVVTGVSPGTATISVRTDEGGFYATTTVTVTAAPAGGGTTGRPPAGGGANRPSGGFIGWVTARPVQPPVRPDVPGDVPVVPPVDTTVNVEVRAGDYGVTIVTVSSAVSGPFVVTATLDSAAVEGFNLYRFVAFDVDGNILGGAINPLTGEFTFTAPVTGEFTIEYVETLNRLAVSIGSNVITDLADNLDLIIMDVEPAVIGGRTLLPVRFVAYALGAEVDWNDATHEVTLTTADRTLTFAIGAFTPGMDVPAQIIDSRTMVPLRFISEFFGAIVDWNDATRTAHIIVG